jgi:hypothetical protein
MFVFRERCQVYRTSPTFLLRDFLLWDILVIRLQDGTLVSIEQVKRCLQHAPLEPGIAGNSERSSKWETHPKCPGRRNCLGMFPYQTDLRRCEAGAFETMGERADGARAAWSDGHEENGVDVIVVKQASDDFRTFTHPGWMRAAAHE